MYRMLESRIAYNGVSKQRLADEIHMNYDVLLAKISGKTKFTLDEAVLIRKYLGESMAVEELFEDG